MQSWTGCAFLTAQRGGRKAQPVQGDQRLAGLDTLVNRLLQEWHAPGVGISVVEKDKVLDGYSVRFEIGADGKAGAMTFIQPNGTFRAVRK